MELTTLHNLNGNLAKPMHISFPSETSLSEAYMVESVQIYTFLQFFDNFNELRCTIPHLNVNDSQLGSDCLNCFQLEI